jgi:hypothetical protein
MLDTFYHNIINKTLGAFGTLFNEVYYRQFSPQGTEISRIKIPIVYSDKQKFIAKLQQDTPDLVRSFETTFPRMGFQIKGIRYAPERKTQTTTKTYSASVDGYSSEWRFEKVPYDIDLSLYIITKNTDEFFQIIEQILPYFTPDYTITIKRFGSLDQRIDIPIVFTGLDINENSEIFDERKTVEATLNFVAKVHLSGPIREAKVIREVDVNFHRYLPDGTYSAAAGLTFLTVQLQVSNGITAGSIGNTGAFSTQIFEYGT